MLKESKRLFLEKRHKILKAIRSFFEKEGFLEVETPLRVPAPTPENHIEPFSSEDWFLITSPELQMKMLLAEGYDKIYQICKVFRKGERGRLHLPEFTLLEWYRAGANYEKTMEDTIRLIRFVGEALEMPDPFLYQGMKLSYSGRRRVFTVEELFNSLAGWNPLEMPDSERFSFDLVEKVEPFLKFSTPTIVKDYPLSESALARCNERTCERFEVYWGGIELANGYSELSDEKELRKRFSMVMEKKSYLRMPESFLKICSNLPLCSGVALGVDRLVMIFTGASSIDQVVTFCPEEL